MSRSDNALVFLIIDIQSIIKYFFIKIIELIDF